ncbi:fasciclin domain-containing protein [Flavobacterium difficile]|uniref:Fasciclin domain-containing protein n=1 Tax=Flavobacterium difficile TaxID=2709659 RepID=A0ABX0I7Q7_9FLAO|nr:fasciclin domain-containing protein [Flavobacterium difficile]NHM02696.1 fasciclin domain-containing protein [Flavobacterium difficile]
MKLINKISKALAVITVALLSFSCENDSENVIEKYPTIVEILEKDPANFSILKAALIKTDLFNTFRNPGSYTVLAPRNSSFEAIGVTEASIATMSTADVALLRRRLQYHVLSIGTISADFPTNGYVNSFSPFGTSTSISLSLHTNKASGIVLNGGLSNGGATVLQKDINASNGVIHVIDAVLSLPKVHNLIIANPDLSSLVGVLSSTPQTSVFMDLTSTATGATNALSRTVFAPTNAAFTNAAFLTGQSDANITKVLRYHIENNNRRASSSTSFASTATTINTQLTGPQQTITIPAATVKVVDITTVNATIRTVNIQGTNGVAHIIDKVLQPTL